MGEDTQATLVALRRLVYSGRTTRVLGFRRGRGCLRGGLRAFARLLRSLRGRAFKRFEFTVLYLEQHGKNSCQKNDCKNTCETFMLHNARVMHRSELIDMADTLGIEEKRGQYDFGLFVMGA